MHAIEHRHAQEHAKQIAAIFDSFNKREVVRHLDGSSTYHMISAKRPDPDLADVTLVTTRMETLPWAKRAPAKTTVEGRPREHGAAAPLR